MYKFISKKTTGVIMAFMLLLIGYSSVWGATSDTVTLTTNIGAGIGVSDATGSITPTIATGDAVILDESTSSIKVYSNETGGFTLTVSVADLDTSPTADQLCNDTIAGGGCDNTDYFSTEGDTSSSYIKVTAVDTGAVITGETGALTPTLMNTSPTALELIKIADNQQIAGATIDFTWDFYADYTVVAQTYEGTLTFTIAATA